MDLQLKKIEPPENIELRMRELTQTCEDAMTRCDIRERLQIMACGFHLLADQIAFETAVQTQALAVIMRDRAIRMKERRRG